MTLWAGLKQEPTGEQFEALQTFWVSGDQTSLALLYEAWASPP